MVPPVKALSRTFARPSYWSSAVSNGSGSSFQHKWPSLRSEDLRQYNLQFELAYLDLAKWQLSQISCTPLLNCMNANASHSIRRKLTKIETLQSKSRSYQRGKILPRPASYTVRGFLKLSLGSYTRSIRFVIGGCKSGQGALQDLPRLRRNSSNERAGSM
ncbi:hypothetical protein L218DRAFT_225993 [Marasmius fiardii PR-910]|nr:hypothetical protein L218DRAFT_225993 [Marasmius fiardii PR-910]